MEDNSGQSTKKSRAVLFILSAVVAAVILGILLLTARHRLSGRNEPEGTPSLQNVPTESLSSPSPDVASRAISTSSIPATRGTPPESKKKDDLNADPVLFPPDTRPPTSEPTASPITDYSRIFRAGEVDQRARVLSKPDPGYTSEARTNQVVGVVVLRAVFSSSGQVTNISAIRGLPHGLTERAIEAAKQITFVPAMKNGNPVSMWMQLEYNFNLY